MTNSSLPQAPKGNRTDPADKLLQWYEECVKSDLSREEWTLIPIVVARYMRMKKALQRCSDVICAAKMGDIPVVTFAQKMAKKEADEILSSLSQ